MKRAATLVLALALGGCQSTVFEHPPIAASSCDPELPGRWLSVGDTPEEQGEVELRLDTQCRLEVLEHEKSGLRTGDATTVHTGQHDGHRYAWVEATWLQKRFEPNMTAEAGDVHVLRYRVEGTELLLWTPDDVTVAHRIIDGDITGDVRRVDGRLENRITGPADPTPLGRWGFFDREEVRFSRAPEVQP